jgi:hypothetical protein
VGRELDLQRAKGLGEGARGCARPRAERSARWRSVPDSAARGRLRSQPCSRVLDRRADRPVPLSSGGIPAAELRAWPPALHPWERPGS